MPWDKDGHKRTRRYCQNHPEALCSDTPPSVGPHPQGGGGRYGVTQYYANDVPSDRVLATIAASGLPWLRAVVCHKEQVQTGTGQYDFSKPDGILAPFFGSPTRLLLLLTDLILPKPPFDGWLAFVAATVAHYRGRVAAYELWNEPRPDWDAATFALLIALSARAVRAADPAALVVAPAFGGHAILTTPFPKAVHDAPSAPLDLVDRVSLHVIHGTADPAEMAQTAHQAAAAVRSWGVTQPLWLTETGISSDPAYVTDPAYQGEQGQARYISERLPAFLGDYETVFWAGSQDGTGYVAGHPFSGNGLFRQDQTPKPAWDALRGLG